MKKKILFTLALVAIAFGVSQVFLQGEDGKSHSQVELPPNPLARVALTPVPEVAIVEPAITQPDLKKPPVSRVSDVQPEGNSFYYLLHPDRKNTQESSTNQEVEPAAIPSLQTESRPPR